MNSWSITGQNSMLHWSRPCTYMVLMCIGVVGMLIALLAVADESEERTLEVSASTSDKDEQPFLPRRRENARLNELRSCTIPSTHRQTYRHTYTDAQPWLKSGRYTIKSDQLCIKKFIKAELETLTSCASASKHHEKNWTSAYWSQAAAHSLSYMCESKRQPLWAQAAMTKRRQKARQMANFLIIAFLPRDAL